MPEIKNIKLYKVTENPYIILRKCVNHSKGILSKYLLGIIAIYILLNWIPEIISLSYTYSLMDFMVDRGMVDENIASQLPNMPSIFVYFYALLFNGVFALGESLYILTYIRNKKVEYTAIVEGYVFYLKAFALFIIKTLFIFIGTMLFIIPGIIAAINMSQVFYILADDPNKPITQIITESNYRMIGNRLTYIKLLIAFLPYILIGYLPVILITFLINIKINTLSGLLLYLVAEIPLYCSLGILGVGKGVFYELLISGGFDNFKYLGQDEFRKKVV